MKWQIFQLHHARTGLKIVGGVIPKEGLADTWFDTDYGIVLCCPQITFCSQCHTKREFGWAGGSEFFWYDNNKELKASFYKSGLAHLGD